MDDQAVVTHGVERIGYAVQDAVPIMEYGAGLAVHEAWRPIDPASEGGGDTLVTQADAEDGRSRMKLTDDFE